MSELSVNQKHPSTVEDLPSSGRVYVILENDSYYSDHGYPGHGSSNPYIDMIVFPNEEEWKAEIEARMKGERPYSTKKFKGVILQIPQVKLSVDVDVK